MTDLPDTDALKGLLAQTTRGPWTAFDWEPPESDGQQVFRRPIGSMRDATTVAKVLGTTSGLLDGFAAPIRHGRPTNGDPDIDGHVWRQHPTLFMLCEDCGDEMEDEE